MPQNRLKCDDLLPFINVLILSNTTVVCLIAAVLMLYIIRIMYTSSYLNKIVQIQLYMWCVYVSTRESACVCVCVHTRVCASVSASVHDCMRTYISTCTYLHARAQARYNIFFTACMHIHKNKIHVSSLASVTLHVLNKKQMALVVT